MKQFNKLLLVLLLTPFMYLNAQITMTNVDRPVANTDIAYGVDTFLLNFNFGTTGPGQVLNYDSLDTDVVVLNSYIAPADAPQSMSFPDADLVLNAGNSFQFIENAEDCTNVIGLSADLDGTGMEFVPIIFDPTQKIASYPFTLNDTFTTNSRFAITLDGGASGFDSILLIENVDITAVADGSGSITLPDGNTYDALRTRQTQTVTDSIFVLFQGEYQLAQLGSETVEVINWIAKESLGLLLQATPRQDSGFQVAYFAQLAAPPIASFSVEDLAGGNFDFMDESTNDPSSWLWDFGDGTTSNLQDPSHVYTENGQYEVCLTVNNDQGMDTTCQTVDVIISNVNDPALASQLQVFPIPTQDVVHFQWSVLQSEPMQFFLFDALGRKVQSHLMQGDMQISLTAHPAGQYFYQISTERGQLLLTGKLMKR